MGAKTTAAQRFRSTPVLCHRCVPVLAMRAGVELAPRVAAFATYTSVVVNRLVVMDNLALPWPNIVRNKKPGNDNATRGARGDVSSVQAHVASCRFNDDTRWRFYTPIPGIPREFWPDSVSRVSSSGRHGH